MLIEQTWGNTVQKEIIVLGTGELAATSAPQSILKTYALGSCIALVLLDPKNKCIGMAHIALPDSTINTVGLKNKPAYFADKAIPALFDEMRQSGGMIDPKNIIIKMAGGASVLDPNGYFNIGKKNILSIKKVLWKYKMGPLTEDVGGEISRTVSVDSDTGIVLVSSHGRGKKRL